MSTCPECGKTREVVHLRLRGKFTGGDFVGATLPASQLMLVCPDRCDVNMTVYREPTPVEMAEHREFLRSEANA